MQGTLKTKKSEKLTPDEKVLLKKFVKDYTTINDAAEAIGIHRNVLDRVLLAFRAAPETISLIRKSLAA